MCVCLGRWYLKTSPYTIGFTRNMFRASSPRPYRFLSVAEPIFHYRVGLFRSTDFGAEMFHVEHSEILTPDNPLAQAMSSFHPSTAFILLLCLPFMQCFTWNILFGITSIRYPDCRFVPVALSIKGSCSVIALPCPPHFHPFTPCWFPFVPELPRDCRACYNTAS